MGFMDELKKLTRPYSEDDDDFEEDFDLEERPRPTKESAAPRRAPRSAAPAAPMSASPYDEVMEGLGSRPTSSRPAPAGPRRGPAGDGKVVNIHTTTQMQVVLVKPDRFDNVSEIAEHLRSKHAVVLNLEATNKDIARRLVDFLSGCAYALDGKIKKIAISTYIITPYNVDLVGDLLDELENSGLYL